MAKPNFRQLEVFRTLMQTFSVSETAVRLHVTQPAVSKTLAALEELVGLPLFKRVRGRLVPTVAAERLGVDVDRIFAHMDLLMSDISGMQTASEGYLTISAVPAMAATLIGKCAGSFQDSRARTRILLSARMSPDAVEDVIRHRSELAFIHGAPTEPEANGRMLGESEFVCAMRADHPLAALDTITPADLAGQPMIFLDRSSPPSHSVRERFAEENVIPHIVLETNMSFAARAALLSSRSIALIDSLFAIIDTQPDIVIRKFRPRVPMQIFCVTSPHRPLSPLAELFINEVENFIAHDVSDANLAPRT
ncbi:LysR substrate-binding domain-containing protein [Klebsiella sp. 2680]|uniref:LysR substrate-binding domain-containing protein n=1 Tax=Klebsiella sp. 2680 TaxID=2018037 RepID=UPI00115B4A72|nr:LysR substrate-binding domain-containing protein [Klebsiella sp. 2680]